jgi:hypothetical protein
MEDERVYRLEVEAASEFHIAIESVYASELRKFNDPHIPKLDSGMFNPEYSLENHLVHSLYSLKREKTLAPIIIGIIRRTSSAIVSYRMARDVAYEYIVHKANTG